ncbi:MAG: phospholipid/cholesterol/gamma-HCH transport system substrate-binding protein [Thermoleophilaceae bacterium]|nr:phospholipid/cholesterol/gamma-HCH transport system substrate-binding protein [Thermoleophilaceae bacterium]
MPGGRRSHAALRRLTAAAILLAAVGVGLILFAGGGSYEVRATFENASQLVKGDQVKVGGVPVGSVSDLTLDSHARARVTLTIDDGDLTPLHQGSRVEVRSVGLASIAGRYIALSPGPNNRAKIGDGGEIRADYTQSEVDLDAILNSLEPATLNDLRGAVRGLSGATSGRARAFNAAMHDLNPALSQTAATTSEVVRDQRAFERFLLESADVVGAVASRRADLERLVPAAGSTLQAIANHTADVDELLRRLPPTLREANTTLVNLRSAIGDLRPTIRLAHPVAPLLNETLVRLRPVAARGLRVIPPLRRLIDRPGREDLLGVLRTMPSLADKAVPAFESGVQTTKDAMPLVEALRAYTPDLFAGQVEGYGGTAAIYYDANGHYTRISGQGTGYTLNGAGALIPTPVTVGGLTGYRKDVKARCPGAATQPAADRSNPWHPGKRFPCNPEDDPR